MKQRSLEPEILDDAGTGAGEIFHSLDFMAFVNRRFGGAGAVVDFFEGQELPPSFTVLDIGTGGGDIPFALAKWARRRGKSVAITAIDVNPHCLEYARTRHACPELRFLQHSAFDIEALGAFDYVISSMFFHHLEDGEIARLLPLMRRQARRGILVNDLERRRLNYWGAAALTAFAPPVVSNDARLSVLRGFRKEEFRRYARQIGLPAKVSTRPFFRVLLSCQS